MSRLLTPCLLVLLISFVVRAEDVPGRGASANQPFGFRVKGTDLAPTTKGNPDLSPVASLLPQKNGKPTLVGLKTMTIVFQNSFTYTADIDSHGRVSGAFQARLAPTGKLAVTFKNFDVVTIFGVQTATDGTFNTAPIAIALSVSDGTTTTNLLSRSDLVITYAVKRGVAKATAAK
jgi:hypothetical protein